MNVIEASLKGKIKDLSFRVILSVKKKAQLEAVNWFFTDFFSLCNERPFIKN